MYYKVTKKAMRPASSKKECFYCHENIGDFHTDSCVLIRKKVLVAATITYEVSMPKDWGGEEIEFQRNDGSWCAANIIGELEELEKSGDCLCGRTEYKYLKDVSTSFLDE